MSDLKKKLTWQANNKEGFVDSKTSSSVRNREKSKSLLQAHITKELSFFLFKLC